MDVPLIKEKKIKDQASTETLGFVFLALGPYASNGIHKNTVYAIWIAFSYMYRSIFYAAAAATTTSELCVCEFDVRVQVARMSKGHHRSNAIRPCG